VGKPVKDRADDSSRWWAWSRTTRRRAAAEAEDAGRMLDGWARRCREDFERSASLHHGLRRAAAVDPEAAALLAQVDHQQRLGHFGLARALAERGALAEGVIADEARHVIATMMSPALHRTLTVQRGWSPDRYECWLARSLRALLLPHTLEAPPRRRRAG